LEDYINCRTISAVIRTKLPACDSSRKITFLGTQRNEKEYLVTEVDYNNLNEIIR